MITIDVWSDFTCPFCYIGKRHLEQAISQFKGKDSVEINWHSYQLDPTIPEDIQTSPVAYLSAAKGISLEDSATMHDNVTRMAKGAGLNYNFDSVQIANSFRAHRLLQRAKELNKGDRLKEALFHAYFCTGQNINSVEDLKAIAISCDLSANDVDEAMMHEKYAFAVNTDIEKSKQMGIKGVPYFVFNNTYALSGAQPVNAFLDALSQVVTQLSV